MEHVKRQIQQGQGTPIMRGCSGAVLHSDTPMLQRLISLISISAKLRHPKHAPLLQNKAEFIALMLGIEIVKIG